jgi:uncharacterized membrane protein YfcA
MVVELAWLAAGVLCTGLVSGTLAGLFGVGGGAVIVPVLFQVFQLLGVPGAVRMQLCIGTSLAIILPTVLRSYGAHKAHGFARTDVLRRWALPSMAGVAVGAGLATVVPSATFKATFALVACLIATKLLFGSNRWNLARELPGRVAMTGYGFGIGLCSSLMGISGGSLATMIMTLYGQPIEAAVATAAGLGIPITLAGTVGYILAGLPHRALLPPLSVGFVSVIGVVLIAPVASWVAPISARFAHRMRKRTLEIAFGSFLLLASARFLASLLVPLL